MTLSHHQVIHVGFWRRLVAFLLDVVLISILTSAIAVTLFGFDYITRLQLVENVAQYDWRLFALEQGIPAIWAIGFWLYWMATPGKMLLDIQVVDSNTLSKPKLSQLVLRYLGYIISSIPLGLGFLWILFDKRKQGWHDKLSNTQVIMQDDSLRPLETHQ